MSVVAIVVLAVVTVLLVAMLLAGLRRSGQSRRRALAAAQSEEFARHRSPAEASRTEAGLRNDV
jgi:hypothetical protein